MKAILFIFLFLFFFGLVRVMDMAEELRGRLATKSLYHYTFITPHRGE